MSTPAAKLIGFPNSTDAVYREKAEAEIVACLEQGYHINSGFGAGGNCWVLMVRYPDPAESSAVSGYDDPALEEWRGGSLDTTDMTEEADTESGKDEVEPAPRGKPGRPSNKK